MFTYRVHKVLRVIDGDTFAVEIKLTPDLTWKTHIRLDGIDTPEKRGPEREEGLKVKKIVTEKIKKAKLIVLVVRKYGKFGRAVAKVYLSRKASVSNEEVIEKGLCLNDWLLKNNYAKAVDYD